MVFRERGEQPAASLESSGLTFSQVISRRQLNYNPESKDQIVAELEDVKGSSWSKGEYREILIGWNDDSPTGNIHKKWWRGCIFVRIYSVISSEKAGQLLLGGSQTLSARSRRSRRGWRRR